MRTKISFVLIIMLSLLSLQAMFVEIGDGTATQSFIPANGYYDQGWSRTVYLQEDLGDAQSYTEIAYQLFNVPSNYQMLTQKIYLKHTTETSITDVAFSSPADDDTYTEVFSGDITWDGTDWFTIVLDSAFEYNGTDNLELFYTNEDGSYVIGDPVFLSTETEDTRACYNFQDSSFPEGDGTFVNYFPNIRFIYVVENEPEVVTYVAPDDNAINLATVVDLQWTMNANTDFVDVYLSDDYQLVSSLDASVLVSSDNATETYTTNELNNLTTYYWRVVACNNETEYQLPAAVRTFATEGGGGVIQVGNGTVVAQSLPCEPYYGYSVSQTIYLQEWLNVDGQRVEEISYHYNGNQAWTEDSITIWMGHTDLNSFESTVAWVSVDDLVMVYDGPMTVEAVDGWITFQLIVPFNYNNTQNLVVGFEQNTGGYHGSGDEFYCTAVEANLSIEKYQDSADYDFVNPPVGNLRTFIPNTIFTMGDVPTEPQLMVTPDEYHWNDTIFNTLGEEKTFTVRNSGLGTLTLNSVTLDQDVDFTLTDATTYPIDLDGNSYQFTVTFNPQSIGDFTANIVFTDADNNVTNIPLTGSGYDATITEFPYFQGFEDDPINTLPLDWASIIESTSIYSTVLITTSYAYEGDQCLRFYNAADTDPSLALVTPPIQDLTGKRVRFMIGATQVGTSMIVGTYDGQAANSTLTPIDTIVVTNTHTQNVVDFAEYTGTDNMIGFQYIPNGDTYTNLVMDNLFIEDIPVGPLFSVMADTLDFGDVYLNREGTAFFTIANWGVTNLTGTVSCDEPYFTFDTADYEIEPEEGQQIEVTFIPQGEGDFLGSFTVTSNDPDMPEFTIYGRGSVLPALGDNIAVIGTGDLVGQHMPIEPYYGYTYSQVIYYPGEIGIEGQQIEKISWYYNGNSAWSGDAFKIYLGHTDINEFATNTSWIDISEFMPVFDDVLDVTTEAGWIEFELDLPFVYDYTRNLVVAVEENTQGYHSSNDEFLCTAATSVRGIIHYSDSVDADPVDPPTANYMMSSFANILLEFGDIPDEPALTVFPANNTFAMTPVNGQSDPRIVNFRSIGLQDIVIDAAPTISGADADQFAISVDGNTYPLTLPFNATAQVSLIFTPTSEGSKNAIMEVVDNATRTTHQVNLSGYAYADDGNDSADVATVLAVPTISELFAIMPEGDIDWYKLPALGVLDTLIIYTEMTDGNNINMRAWIYGPATSPADIDLNAPIASDSYGHGNNQPQITVEIPESGDYYLRIAENSIAPAGANTPSTRKNPNGESDRNTRENIGLYELTVDAIFNYDYNSPINLEAVNSTGFVSLSWTEPPFERYLVSYDVYRDGEQLNNVPIGENTYSDATVIVGTEYTYTVVGIYEEPTGQSLPSNAVSITYFTTGEALFSDDFEAHNDFALEMANWIQYDEDGAGTYAISGVDFENSGEPMSYIVFNPSMAVPAIVDMDPQSGEKILCSFASTEGTNDDWLVSPRITIGTTTVVSFYARSYTDQYELEKFKVLMSQGGEEVDDFTFSLHQGTEYLVAPTEWTPYYFNVSELTGMTVRFAVQCISNDGFIFMMDNFRVDSTDDGVSNGNDVTPALTQLAGNYPNPFNPETTISYSMKEAGDVRIDIYNLKGQRVKTLVNEFTNEGAHQVVWNGQDDSSNSCASGVYFYKMRSGKYSKTKKMILMK